MNTVQAASLVQAKKKATEEQQEARRIRDMANYARKKLIQADSPDQEKN
ncbi:hypothetical protein ACP4OV_005002 [Aristida adscensionis]